MSLKGRLWGEETDKPTEGDIIETESILKTVDSSILVDVEILEVIESAEIVDISIEKKYDELESSDPDNENPADLASGISTKQWCKVFLVQISSYYLMTRHIISLISISKGTALQLL